MITFPAPSSGWNARDSYAEMPPTDAIELVNLIPSGSSVKTRPGYTPHTDDLGTAVNSLFTYHGATEKLLAVSGGDLIDVTAGGSGTAITISPAGSKAFPTSNKVQTTEFKNRVIMCNGADSVKDYNGTTLSATSISGATSADLIDCVTHHGRVYYVEKDSQSFWYAAAGAYSGALTEYDLSEFTTTGGDLLTLISWTRDSGAGVDDILVCVMDTGEMLAYAGSDPGSVTDWQLLGRFRIGEPLGRRCATNVGGDVIILTVDGYVPLSAALQEGRYTEQSNFSFKIDNAAAEAAQAYGTNFGWEAIHWPQASLFFVNVPLSASQSVQHVRDTTKGGWCKFTGLNATTWAVYDEDLYFGDADGYVHKISGSSDNGAFISFSATQAFTFFGEPGRKKQVTAVQPITTNAYPKYFSVNMFQDFNVTTLPSYGNPPEPSVSDWNTGSWNVAEWATYTASNKLARRNLTGTGFSLALSLRFKSRAQTTIWFASNFWIKPAGVV